jgi:hypothetical protein
MTMIPIVELDYDYIEIIYKDNTTRLDYFDLTYNKNYGINEKKHLELLNFERECL